MVSSVSRKRETNRQIAKEIESGHGVRRTITDARRKSDPKSFRDDGADGEGVKPVGQEHDFSDVHEHDFWVDIGDVHQVGDGRDEIDEPIVEGVAFGPEERVGVLIVDEGRRKRTKCT